MVLKHPLALGNEGWLPVVRVEQKVITVRQFLFTGLGDFSDFLYYRLE